MDIYGNLLTLSHAARPALHVNYEGTKMDGESEQIGMYMPVLSGYNRVNCVNYPR